MDKYQNFAELAAAEQRGRDYQIRKRYRANNVWVVLAPHGGGIEPGTSEIAGAVARGIHSCYRFEGIKPRGNGDLHITSTRFDEPHALKMAAAAHSVLAVHGEASKRQMVYLGGRDLKGRRRLKASLEARGFVVKRHSNKNLAGLERSNICNRGRRGKGVQIELSLGLRRACFKSLSRAGRRVSTPTFSCLVQGLRAGLAASNLTTSEAAA